MQTWPARIEQIAQLNERLNYRLRAEHVLIRCMIGQDLITVYRKKINKKLSPASTIKLFMLDEALQRELHHDDRYIEIEPKHICKGSGNNLKIGHHYKVRDLIENLTVSSSNTAAMVLQDFIQTSEGINLLQKINTTNLIRGMQHSYFKNLHGLRAPGHYLTLADFSKFLDQKLFDDVFLEKLRMPTIDFVSFEGHQVKESNTFSLLKKFENEILGVKTGTLLPNVYHIVLFLKLGQMRAYAANFLNITSEDQKYDVIQVIELLKKLVGN